MQIVRPVGRQAASRKYDLITALGVHACRGDKHFQRLVLRFITMIVARYNWQSDELSIGQRELATLWAVDERTVKREMAKLRGLGWLVQKRGGGAGQGGDPRPRPRRDPDRHAGRLARRRPGFSSNA